MTLAIDTNVLIPWLVRSAPGHASARRLLEDELARGVKIAVVQQVIWEFLHVVTDPRRFSAPLDMEAAMALVRAVRNAPETAHVVPHADLTPRVLELLAMHRLGRKRILDTVLAATLESAGIRRLATLNGSDFRCFDFIDIVEPPG